METDPNVLSGLIAAERRKWDSRRQLVGWLNAGLGILGTGGLVWVGFLIPPADRGAVIAAILVMFLPLVIGGVGFALGRRWATLVLWPVSVLLLVAFPVGTALGAYSLWVLYGTRQQTGTSRRALVIASLAPAFLVIGILPTRFHSKSALERELLAAVETEGGKHEFERWLSTVSGPPEAQAALIMRVGKPGLLRLDTTDQLLRLLELTRFRGHFTVMVEGVLDASDTESVSAGVS